MIKMTKKHTKAVGYLLANVYNQLFTKKLNACSQILSQRLDENGLKQTKRGRYNFSECPKTGFMLTGENTIKGGKVCQTVLKEHTYVTKEFLHVGKESSRISTCFGVHHIDHDKTNNSPQNICYLKNKDLHRWNSDFANFMRPTDLSHIKRIKRKLVKDYGAILLTNPYAKELLIRISSKELGAKSAQPSLSRKNVQLFKSFFSSKPVKADPLNEQALPRASFIGSENLEQGDIDWIYAGLNSSKHKGV